MSRRKKEKSIQIEEKEVHMTEADVMESKEKVLDLVQTELDLARVELERTKLEIAQQKHDLELLKKNPKRPLEPQEQEIYEKQVTMSHEKSTLKDKIERQKVFDSQMVTIRFMNRRVPGQPVKLPYVKYDTDPVKWYPFEDGKVYTIPRGFADQINGGDENNPCYYTPIFNQIQGEMNPDMPESSIHSVDTSNKKYAAVAVNY